MKRTLFLGALALAVASASAHAAVTCTPTNNSIVFGAYDPLGGALLDGTGSFQITCVNAGGPAAGVDLVWFASVSGVATRQLAPPAGADRLGYELYTDAARSTVWGDGTAGTTQFSGTMAIGKNASVTTAPIAYYGRILGGQDVSAAMPGPSSTTYTQTLTITVTCTRPSGAALAC